MAADLSYVTTVGLYCLLQLLFAIVRSTSSSDVTSYVTVASHRPASDNVVYLLNRDDDDISVRSGSRSGEGNALDAPSSFRFVDPLSRPRRVELSRGRRRRSRRGFSSADEDEIINRLNDVRRTYPASNMQSVTYDNQLESFITMWALHCDARYNIVNKSKYFYQTWAGIYADNTISIKTAETDLFANSTIPFLYANIVSIGCTQMACDAFKDEFGKPTSQRIYLFACLVGFDRTPERPIASNFTCSACSMSYVFCRQGLCADVATPENSGSPPPSLPIPPPPPPPPQSTAHGAPMLPNSSRATTSLCTACQTKRTVTSMYQDDSLRGSSIGAVIGVVCGVTLFVVLVVIISLHIIVYRRKVLLYNSRRQVDNNSPVNIYSLPPPTSSSSQDEGHIYIVPISHIVSPPPYSEHCVYLSGESDAAAQPPPYTVVYDNVAKEIFISGNELPLSVSTSITNSSVEDEHYSVLTNVTVPDGYNIRTESMAAGSVLSGTNNDNETAPPAYKPMDLT